MSALIHMFEILQSHPVVFIGYIVVLSLLIGSFLNVVIHRLPIMLEREWRQQSKELLESQPSVPLPADGVKYNLVLPRSACPRCGMQITALQNIPIVSWMLLKGHCANCKASISSRYPLVEFGTALASAVVAWRFGFSLHMLAALVMTWMLIAMSMIDVDHQILPDNMTLPLVWLGLLLSLGNGAVLPVTPRDAIIGAAAGYISLWLVFHLFKLITGKEGMGYGDFKLFAAFGAWFGWQMLPLIILLSACTGAVIGILLIVLRGRDRNIPIPFGPYLAAAGWIAMLWGEDIVGWYLGMIGVG